MEDLMAKRKKNKQDKYLVNRNGVYYFRKTVNGKPIQWALSSDKATARSLRNDLCREILINGELQPRKRNQPDCNRLFGEVAEEWALVAETELANSSFDDYQGSMNKFVLPKFGNVPIREITPWDVRKFMSTLKCSNKRKNNILAPFRGVFEMAKEAGYIERNAMLEVKGYRVEKGDIDPLSMEDVKEFLKVVVSRWKNFFIVAFLTGMRFGEISALKRNNVDFKRKIIKIVETRVKGVERPPKTKKSKRTIKMLPPVEEALRDQMACTFGKSEYVFLNQYGRPVAPGAMNSHIWKPALEKAELKARPLIQTRHTFATIMLDAGEHPGWVQKMMGHETLQMIYEHYYDYIKSYSRAEGRSFMANAYEPIMNSDGTGQPATACNDPKTTQMKKGESETISNPPIPVALPTLVSGAEAGI
jgi:integrase